jgi:predicted kinase
MKKQTLFILCGEAFSGKSTLSKQIAGHYDAKVVGRDEIYFATEKILSLENTPDEDDDALWENLWPLVLQGVKNQLLLGNSVVVDDNCLYLKQRDELRAIAHDTGVGSTLVYLDIPSKILKERKEQNKISKTRHDVPSAWMDEDSGLFERPTEKEAPVIYTPDVVFGAFLEKLI